MAAVCCGVGASGWRARLKTVGYWSATTILVFAVGSGGVAELARLPGNVEGTEHVPGYPVYYMNILGLWKVLGSIALTSGGSFAEPSTLLPRRDSRRRYGSPEEDRNTAPVPIFRRSLRHLGFLSILVSLSLKVAD